MNLGDTVFAVGTPVSMNFKFTVTRGIISGKDRLMSMSNSKGNTYYYSRQAVTSESWYINLLQIDASINSGNSGGPLCNANGEVIGINNSKLSSSDIENIGFAVPIEDVINIAEQIIESGSVIKPYLGVSLTTVEAARLNGINIDENVKGAVISNVEDGSTFDKAGIKTWDIVTKIDNYSTPNYKYLKYYLYRYKVGDKVTITYLRDGKEHTAEITLQKKS
jgi:serine protease Do